MILLKCKIAIKRSIIMNDAFRIKMLPQSKDIIIDSLSVFRYRAISKTYTSYWYSYI